MARTIGQIVSHLSLNIGKYSSPIFRDRHGTEYRALLFSQLKELAIGLYNYHLDVADTHLIHTIKLSSSPWSKFDHKKALTKIVQTSILPYTYIGVVMWKYAEAGVLEQDKLYVVCESFEQLKDRGYEQV